jgi:hypothetical protein
MARFRSGRRRFNRRFRSRRRNVGRRRFSGFKRKRNGDRLTERRMRSRIRARQTTGIGRPVGSFDESKFVKLKYAEQITLDPAAAGASVAVPFSANGLFDPDPAIGGHQPMYYDNYSAIYARYQVMFAKIRVTFMNSQPSTAIASYGYRCAVYADQQINDFPTSFEQIQEAGSSCLRWKFVPPHTENYWKSIELACYPHKIAGVDKADDTLQSGTGSNPSKQIYFVILAASASDDLVDPIILKAAVVITYYVRFSDLIHNQTIN